MNSLGRAEAISALPLTVMGKPASSHPMFNPEWDVKGPKGCTDYRHRGCVAGLLKNMNFVRFLEIGVFRGGHSALLWNNPAISSLLLVDPMRLNQMFVKDLRITNKELDEVVSRIQNEAPPHVTFLRMTSQQAASLASHASDWTFDFIYLDNQMKEVEQDIRAWWPMLRKGGIFAGNSGHKSHIQKAIRAAGKEFVMRGVIWVIRK